MHGKINCDIPLFLAYQKDTSTIPSDFSITCLLYIKPKGVFESSFHFDDLIACGTTEGPIILAGIKENQIHHVSLLCGHSYQITNFEETLQGDNFISISSDCTVCSWSTCDGSCLFKADLPVSMGDYRLSICPSEPFLVWIWSIGSSLYLFNLETRSIVYSIPVGGLRYFSIISPHTSSCVSSTVAVCSTLDKLITYAIEENQTLTNSVELEIPNFIDQSYVVCQRGLIKHSRTNGDWSIIRPTDGSSIISSTFPLDEDDVIFGVEWQYASYFCIGSFKAKFLLVTLKRFNDQNNQPSLSISSTKLITHNSFLTYFTYFEDKVIFSPDSKAITVISDDKVMTLKGKKCSRQFNVSEMTKDSVIQTDGNSNVTFYNILEETETDKHEFDGKITALFTRYGPKSSPLHIVNGYSDGRITFWALNSEVSQNVTTFCLPSPVIAFVEPQFKQNTRSLLLALSHTSCCLFKWNDLIAQFNLGNFPILAVYFLIESSHFIFYLSNGAYLVFGENCSQPIDVLSQVPPNAILVYSKCQKTKPDKLSSAICLQLSGRTLYYQLIDISELHKLYNEKNEQIGSILSMIKKAYRDNNENKNGSLVIIGYDNTPTFFYHPFSITTSSVLNASPIVAASHFIIKSLLAQMNETNDEIVESETEQVVDFLPILLQLLYSSNLTIQTIAAKACANLNYMIKFAKCQELVSPYVLNERYHDLDDPEMFLMALLASKYSNALPVDLLPKVFQFLTSQESDSPSVVAAMAAFILIDGITVWTKFEVQKNLYTRIIRSVLNQKSFKFLYDRFNAFVFSDVELMTDVLLKFIDSASQKQAEAALILYHNAELANPKMAGGNMSNAIAAAGNSYTSLSELSMSLLRKQAEKLPYVDVINKTALIGTSTGLVYVYIDSKLKAKDEIFKGKINKVSISPKGECGMALSADDLCGKIFNLKKSCQVLHSIEITSPPQDTAYSVNWLCEDNASISFVHV
ncbi:hypothetical protein TRFO_24460 [Tritrichomonas foetus]|uniref:Uncharacterized protein n=1 Tax=Tritrichomonas foetus TaxID=1144522 RepID=A0A1J4KCJ9_9EUKA|nr:hypothetical protein TRFO_24460 [Tritrichomonas foetus]|eukprot:OHT07374.1 hypothetical protein TRFO_24460 [Tritrichomonas foetus]